MPSRRQLIGASAGMLVAARMGILTTGMAASAQAKSAGVDVYFFRGGQVGVARRTRLPQDISIFQAALIELSRGPFPSEQAVGLSTTFRNGTDLLSGVDLDPATGVATVDYSANFLLDITERDANPALTFARAAQVVFTLTRFPEIQGVVITVEQQPFAPLNETGEPIEGALDRSHVELLSPAILLESPTPWESVKSPLIVTGTSNTFEASLIYRLTGEDDEVLAEGPGMATSGTGTRGTFELEIPYTVDADGRGTLMLYESSAVDGSEINTVAIPVQLTA